MPWDALGCLGMPRDAEGCLGMPRDAQKRPDNLVRGIMWHRSMI